MAVISAPAAKITFGEKDININNAYILLNNSRIDITGKVADYTTKNLKFNINAKGNLLASDIRSMIPADMRSMVSAKVNCHYQLMLLEMTRLKMSHSI